MVKTVNFMLCIDHHNKKHLLLLKNQIHILKVKKKTLPLKNSWGEIIFSSLNFFFPIFYIYNF